ncbi:MAG: NAD(P)H-dependent oxidoreductase [Lentisphaerae bacterium]|nr:NAD(P)H-dependent oxidoreductase [Lentisphaerota bacterium]
MHMRTLVIYYSFSGSTRLIAERIAAATGGRVLELEMQNPIPERGFGKFFRAGGQALMRSTPVLNPLAMQPAGYDLLFIGTPVWAGTLAPPLRTFLRDVELAGKAIALFCCHGGGGPSRTFAHLRKALAGNRVVSEIAFYDPRKHNTDTQIAEAEAWARQVQTSQDGG